MHIVRPHRGRLIQRGHGLFGVFRSLARRLVPLGKQFLKSDVAKKVGRVVKDEALRVGAETAADTLAGHNVGKALEKHLGASGQRVLNRMETAATRALNKNASLGITSKKKKKKKKKGSVLARGRGTLELSTLF